MTTASEVLAHFPTVDPARDVVYCSCGADFTPVADQSTSAEQWAVHVADILAQATV